LLIEKIALPLFVQQGENYFLAPGRINNQSQAEAKLSNVSILGI
jgi:hypothetical protein